MSVVWRGAEAKARAHRGAVRGLQTAAERLLEASKPEVPVSPWSRGGFLRDSGAVAVDEAALRACVGYGPDFGVYVHERMDVSHPTGNAKFIENPLNANKADLLAEIADGIRGEL